MKPAGAPRRNRDALIASPIFASVRSLVAALPESGFPALDALNAIAADRKIATGGGAALRFVVAETDPDATDRSYEERVFETGAVPTRESSWHDLFNALIWLAFPHTKATLNRRHCEELRERRGQPLRGTARDVLTLFDEGGVLVACADPSLSRLLRDFRWKDLFWQRRSDVRRRMRFHVFGHAILETALAPFRGLTAKALILDARDGALEWPTDALNTVLDARAAEYFAAPDALASTRSLAPLPILGIPGWTPENDDPAYYDDVGQFRPGRRRERLP
jgi:hypothetical protein